MRDAGAYAYRVGVVSDDRLELRSTLEDQLVRADVILTTGGLSSARNDTLIDVLRALGDVESATLALEPAARHALAVLPAGGGREVAVVALPGRPAAAALAFEAYVRPSLREMAGFDDVDRGRIEASAAKGWPSPEGAVQVVPVRLTGDGPSATPVGDPTRPSLADLVASDALAYVGADVDRVRRGDAVACALWGA